MDFGSSQSGDGRRDHGKYLCFLDAIYFHIEALYYGFSRMFLSLAFIPVFQYDEVSGRIALLSTSHHGEAGYADVVFGMALNTLLATVYIPNFYELMQKLQEKFSKKQ